MGKRKQKPSIQPSPEAVREARSLLQGRSGQPIVGGRRGKGGVGRKKSAPRVLKFPEKIEFPVQENKPIQETCTESGQGAEGKAAGEGAEKGIAPQANSQSSNRKSTRLNSSHLVISYAVF